MLSVQQHHQVQEHVRVEDQDPIPGPKTQQHTHIYVCAVLRARSTGCARAHTAEEGGARTARCIYVLACYSPAAMMVPAPVPDPVLLLLMMLHCLHDAMLAGTVTTPCCYDDDHDASA